MVSSDLDVEAALAMIAGAVYLRALVSGRPVDDWIARVVVRTACWIPD